MMDHPVVLVLTTTAAIVIASVVMIRAIVETITKPVRTKLSVKVASALLKDRLCLPTQLSDQIFGFIASVSTGTGQETMFFCSRQAHTSFLFCNGVPTVPMQA
jgi:hypothetical protein